MACANAAWVVVTLSMSAGCSARATSEDTGNTTKEPADSVPETGCELDTLVRERVADDAVDCSSEPREELAACAHGANGSGADAFWLSPQRAAVDSSLQDGVIVYADGSVETLTWDSDPTGGASYAPTATVASCASLADDPELSCPEPRDERTLCSFGKRL